MSVLRKTAGGSQGLDPSDVEAIARRVVELIADEAPAPPRYLDTAALARMLDASEDWVRDHAAELGGVRFGDGPTGALRFEPARVREALERRRLPSPRPSPRRSRPGPKRRAESVRLLPLPEAR